MNAISFLCAMSVSLDKVFGALADPSRRRIVEAVREKEQTVAEISSLFDMSLPAVSKHLKVLDEAGLLLRTRSGKYMMCRYNPAPCKEAIQWINEQQRFWNDSFDALADFLDKENK